MLQECEAKRPEAILEAIVRDLHSLTVDQIKDRVGRLMVGYSLDSPVFKPGRFLYRARKVNSRFRKVAGIGIADLSYPPSGSPNFGRLNRPHECVFYGSLGKEAPFFEVPDLKAGDEVILSFWKTTAEMYLNNIGYTQHVFEQLGARRPCPSWKDAPKAEGARIDLPAISDDVLNAMNDDERGNLRRLFSSYFTKQTFDLQPDIYKLTTAIGELHLGRIDETFSFAGVIYPSVRMWANSDNVALQKEFVDSSLQFRKAVHVRVDSREGENRIDIKYLDAANSLDEFGRLRWLGRTFRWSVPSGGELKFTAVAGPDLNGDYEVSPDGQPVHWEAINPATGEAVHPA